MARARPAGYGPARYEADVDELKTRIKNLIVVALHLEEVDPSEIPDAAPLFGGDPLHLDSVDALELVVEIEREFGIQLADDEESRKVLHSVDSLAAHLAPLLAR